MKITVAIETPEQFQASWEPLRNRGMKFFILNYGVLRWGLPMGVVFAILGWFQISAVVPRAVVVILPFPFCLVGGVCFGFILWKMRESRYAKIIERKAKSQRHDDEFPEEPMNE